MHKPTFYELFQEHITECCACWPDYHKYCDEAKRLLYLFVLDQESEEQALRMAAVNADGGTNA